MIHSRHIAAALLALQLVFWGRPGQADQAPSATLLVPDSTLVYWEMRQPAELFQQIARHPATERFLASEEFAQASQNPELRQLMTGLAVFGFAMQQEWQAALQDLFRHGIVVAVDGPTKGVVVLVRPQDKETVERFRRVAVKLIRDEAARKGEPDPVRSNTYREIPFLEFQQWKVAAISEWSLFTNHDGLGRQILDRHLDMTGVAPADHRPF